MLFSIIVPVYNVEKYLCKCIESVLAQSFHDYELILVDDGSSDRSSEICDAYMSQDKRVKVLHKENQGQSAARNDGLSLASGDYVVYMDSDDFLLNTDVLQHIEDKTKAQKDIIVYKTASCDEAGERITYPHMSFGFNAEKCSIAEMVAITVAGEEFQSSAWSKAIKRSLLIDNKISFKTGLVGEDIDWYLEVIKAARSYEVVDEYVYVYRSRPGSITKTAKIKNLTDLLWIIDKWCKKLLGGGYQPSLLDSALLHYLGKTYTGLLIMYAGLSDQKKKEYKKEIISYSYLLRYDRYPRTRMIGKFYAYFGFEVTIIVLKCLLRLKR